MIKLASYLLLINETLQVAVNKQLNRIKLIQEIHLKIIVNLANNKPIFKIIDYIIFIKKFQIYTNIFCIYFLNNVEI